MRKILCAVIFCLTLSGAAFPATNSSEAFLSLPFGHTYARTQKRMENSGAKVLTPRKDSLTMEGMFENYPATFIFGFHKNKLLKSKSVYLQSMGNAEYDKTFYEALRKGMNALYGKTNETPTRVDTRQIHDDNADVQPGDVEEISGKLADEQVHSGNLQD